MSIYDSLGQSPAPMNPMQMLARIKRNPSDVLRHAGLSIPQGMSDPSQILQHLLSTGQVPQSKYQQAMRMAQSFRK